MDYTNTQEFHRKCYACKKVCVINRNKNTDLLYFDNHFYHEDCFKESLGIKRKCSVCKKDINITGLNDIHNIIYYDKKFYHKECFIDYCENHRTKKWTFALQHIKEYEEDAVQKIKPILENKKYGLYSIEQLKKDAKDRINKYFMESDVNTFIKNAYGVIDISPIWRQLNQVYSGTWKNMTCAIPADHLLDMWKRKLNYLNNNMAYNVSKNKGEPLKGYYRILYDLATLISKYDDYLKWLNKSKILESEIQSKPEEYTQNSINYFALKNEKDKKDKSKEDIDNILDDLFIELDDKKD